MRTKKRGLLLTGCATLSSTSDDDVLICVLYLHAHVTAAASRSLTLVARIPFIYLFYEILKFRLVCDVCDIFCWA